MRFRFIDIALFALTFIFVNAFPVDLLPLDIVGQLAVRIGLRVILLAYYIYTLWRRRINIFRFANYRRVLLLACQYHYHQTAQGPHFRQQSQPAGDYRLSCETICF